MKLPLPALLLAATFSLIRASLWGADTPSSAPKAGKPEPPYSLATSPRDTGPSVPVFETKTHKVVGKINVGKSPSKPYAEEDISAVWSKDGFSLVWSAMGKWGPDALVFARINDRGELTSKSILSVVRSEILARLKAEASTYDKVRKKSRGFTIDIHAMPSEAPSQVLLKVGVTSDPNLAQPSRAQLEADMTGELSEEGQFKPATVHIYGVKELADIAKESDAAFKDEEDACKRLLALVPEAKKKQLEEQEQQWKDDLNKRAEREMFSFTGAGWTKAESALYRAHADELRRLLKEAGQER